MSRLFYVLHWILLLQIVSDHTGTAHRGSQATTGTSNGELPTVEFPRPFLNLRHLNEDDDKKLEERRGRSHRRTLMDIALQVSAKEGLDAMTELYRRIEPDIIRNGQLLAENHPAALLSRFSAPVEDTQGREMAAFAAISATKAFKKNYKYINDLARQAHNQKISLRRTALEGLCPPREPPTCMPASERYRTHDGTCNNKRRLRWGAAQMPFNRFLPPEYGDGVDTIRSSVAGGALSSSRFVSLLVHGSKDGEAPLTLMTAQWGQLLDHDLTSTAQPRSINGSVPSCCGGKDFHPSCFPIKVPLDDPWLSPLKVRCLEFLRSAPAQRRDCVLSWREQTNQATSYIDASPIYSSSAKMSDNARVFRNGLLVFGRGNPVNDVCQQGAIATQCIRAGDGRSGEQPGLLALHHVWVGEHNRIAIELSEMNPHWSDEKLYQEARRIIGAMFQHITYREFLPIILGREVCKLFDLELQSAGYYEGYDPKTNPTVANSFAAAAFRFGHSLVQSSYMRCDRHHNRINNNVSLHEEFQRGDIGSAGSLHRLIRGMASQRALKRDEFITPELTNHLFQTPGFPFGLDLAAINIQRGRDHGIAPYTSWRVPCGLTPINNWEDFANVVGPESANRIGHAYRSVHDIDLFVGGIAERPVVGGLVGPTFACIIAQQFSNSRKGDRFWYENGGFESSFTPAQLHSLRRVSLAQVLCRAVGGGTFQPHIFIPHEFTGNERLPCGIGVLAPIDLTPWLEQDPFEGVLAKPTFETVGDPDREFDIIPSNTNSLTVQVLKENKEKIEINNRVKPIRNTSLPLLLPSHHTPHVDFIPNASSGFQRPQNISKVNDKLDFKHKGSTTRRTTQRPISGIHNKLDKGSKVTINIKNVNRRRPQPTTRRTVVVNNIPIELRSANLPEIATNSKNQTTTMTRNSNMPSSNMKTTNNPDKFEPREEGVDYDHDDDHDHDLENKRKFSITYTDIGKTSSNVDKIEFSNISKNSGMGPPNTLTRTNLPQNNEQQEARSTEDDISLNDHSNVHNTTKSTNDVNRPPITTDDEIAHSGLSLRTEYTKNDSDIDPLTHTSSNEQKRVQRKLSSAELSTDYRNVVLRSTNFTMPQKTLSINSTTIWPNDTSSKQMDQPSYVRNIKVRSTTIAPTSPKPTKLAKITKTTLRSVELRQYQTRPIYTRPQKVIVDGPNSNQYEIEINIRQTNKSPVLGTGSGSNYGDYTTAYKPYGYDRFTSTTPAYAYYQPPPSTELTYSQLQRTKPPTVIYLNEHDERTTTTKQPGLLQNFLSFASNSFGGGNRNPIHHSNVQKDTEKPLYSSNIASNLVSSAHSSLPSVHSYIPPQVQNQLPQSQLPISSSSYSQISGYHDNGGFHATSGAISSGHYGSISGVASANGGDSTFSFNIRHPSSNQAVLGAVKPSGGSYGLLPHRRPPFGPSVTPEYVNFPIVTPDKDQYYEQQQNYDSSLHSPFSSGHKRPLQQSYLSRAKAEPQKKEALINDIPHPTNHKLDIRDFDYFSRTLESDHNISSKGDRNEEETSGDGMDYDQYDDENPDKKFDRDGYLRPEHMLLGLLKNLNSTAKSSNESGENPLDDNFVLPLLNGTEHTFADLPMPMTQFMNWLNLTTTTTNFPDSLSKNLDSDVLAEGYDGNDEETTTGFFLVPKTNNLTTRSKTNLERFIKNVAFAPIKILTKPERPDNWVIFDSPVDASLLPEQPEVNSDQSAAAEVPMPFVGLENAWISKYGINLFIDQIAPIAPLKQFRTDMDNDGFKDATGVNLTTDCTDTKPTFTIESKKGETADDTSSNTLSIDNKATANELN